MRAESSPGERLAKTKGPGEFDITTSSLSCTCIQRFSPPPTNHIGLETPPPAIKVMYVHWCASTSGRDDNAIGLGNCCGSLDSLAVRRRPARGWKSHPSGPVGRSRRLNRGPFEWPPPRGLSGGECVSKEIQNNKCAHPACACVTDQEDEYCSQSCKEAADLAEIACQCGHLTCATQSVRA